jgi:esterase/lipase superfamily enzyme
MGRAARFLLPLAVLAAAFLSLGLPAAAQDRYAVVIGAENYAPAIGVQAGAIEDARHVSDALRAEGFVVELIEDPGEGALKRSIFTLVDRLNGADGDAVGLFYFAGAGVQLNGETFLLPIDARTADDLTLSGSGLIASEIADRLDAVEDATSLIVLDGASPNALTSRFSLEPGLAAFDEPENGLLVLSHSPDEVALPRQPGVSVFARAFADLVRDAAADFEDALQTLRRTVSDESGGDRYVWISGRARPGFSLSAGLVGATDDIARDAPPSPPPPAAAEPTPVPATRSQSAGAGAGPAAEAQPAEEIHLVEVYFGTDRGLQMRDGAVEFSSETAAELTYGVAEVSIPPLHVTGRLESPRWWRFEFSPDPERHVVYRGASLREEDEFFSEVRDAVQESEQKQAFVFIHGFNTQFVDAARRTAQMHHDLNFDGAPIFYSWPSQGSASPVAYVQDGNAADRSAPKLKDFLMEVADRTGAVKIHLIAHSMGNRPLVEALDEIAEDLAQEGRAAPFNQIILSAPDIDRDVFENVAEQILPTAARVTLYASANDRALTVSREFNGNPRAGDSSEGVVIVPGLNTIDASEVRTELFDTGHDYFAGDDSILGDMAEVMRTNADPDMRGLSPLSTLPPEALRYWAILSDAIDGPR